MKKYLFLFLIIFSICIVSVATSTAFFTKNNNISGNITLGEVDFTIYSNFNKEEIVMPGDTIKCPIYLVNSRDSASKDTNGLAPIYIRFDVELICKNENLSHTILLNNEKDFIVINDTYYHISPINPSQSIVLLDSIYFDNSLSNTFAGKSIEIVLTADAIQATNNAIQDLWPEFYNKLQN